MSKSILQPKSEKVCYLCRLLNVMNKDEEIPYVEEHHVMFGPFHEPAEHYGLKVNLCVWHHRTGKEAVHKDAEMADLLKKIAQVAFCRKYGYRLWMETFMKNYLDKEEKERYLKGVEDVTD